MDAITSSRTLKWRQLNTGREHILVNVFSGSLRHEATACFEPRCRWVVPGADVCTFFPRLKESEKREIKRSVNSYRSGVTAIVLLPAAARSNNPGLDAALTFPSFISMSCNDFIGNALMNKMG